MDCFISLIIDLELKMRNQLLKQIAPYSIIQYADRMLDREQTKPHS